MSISQLFHPNSYDLCAKSIACDVCTVTTSLESNSTVTLQADNSAILSIKDTQDNYALFVDTTTLRTYIASLDVDDIDAQQISLTGNDLANKLVVKDSLDTDILRVNTVDKKVTANILATNKLESNNVLYTLPPADGLANQILSTDGSANLTWKSDTISNVAGSLATTTTDVDIGSSVVPSIGQTLIATGPSAATWQTPSAGVASDTLNVSTKTAAEVVSSVNLTEAATDLATPNTLVERDPTGNITVVEIRATNLLPAVHPGDKVIGFPLERWSKLSTTNISDDGSTVTLDNAIIGSTTGADIETSVTDTQAATSIPNPNTICKRDGDSDISLHFLNAENNMPDTGLVTGGHVTINVDPTKFDISPGSGILVNYDSLPAMCSNVAWIAQTIVPTNLLTNDKTYLQIDAGGITQSTTKPTTEQSRKNINIAIVHHPSGVITSIDNHPSLYRYPLGQLRDLYESIGRLNIDGNLLSAPAPNLRLQRSAGHLLSYGGNNSVDLYAPNVIEISAALSPAMFPVLTQTGVEAYPASNNEVRPAKYDLNGVVTNTGNKWTVQRFYLKGDGTMYCMLGQALYDNDNAAADSISLPFIVLPDLAQNATFIGYLVLKGDGVNLQDPGKAIIHNVGKFGSSSSGGQELSTMQSTYENSTQPIILTNPTSGKLSIKQGTGANADIQLSVQSNGGTDVVSFAGNGQTVFASQKTGVNQIISLTSKNVGITGADVEKFNVSNNGDVFNNSGVYGLTSDERLKKDITPGRNYLEDINKLKVKKYAFKSGNGEQLLGFVAQDVEQVFPGLVSSIETPQFIDEKSIKLSVMIPMLVSCIQDLSRQLTTIANRPATGQNSAAVNSNTTMINTLAGKISILEMQMASLVSN